MQQKQSRLEPWTVEDSRRLYRLDGWGKSFFAISGNGDLLVKSRGRQWNLAEIVRSSLDREMRAPVLVRFTPIISARLAELNRAFQTAIDEFVFDGTYQCVYPVKVNQHREVIDAFVSAAKQMGGGLEAGSKAELLAVVALADNQMPLICNGFKDESIVEMALRAAQLGRQVTIVIEKPEDAEIVARVSKRIGFRPQLGVRVKLAARSSGRWQGSVGSKSKFGLTSVELEKTLSILKQYELVDQCRLLHFHPGSQVNSIRNIKSCIIEATRIYADLLRRGIPIKTMDVGGGLAVDYTGNRDTLPSSMNYSLQEYANDVIYYVQMVCKQEGTVHPNIISESGRALVAHHSVLVIPVISTSRVDGPYDLPDLGQDEKKLPLIELRDIINELDEKNMQECFHDAQQAVEMAYQLFINGHLTLKQRSLAEEMFSRVCQMIQEKLNEMEFEPAELAELRHLFADTYLANFSVFQSLPDHWAIDHLFPIMPIHRLDERPDCRGVIGDITCDSDGKIGYYLSGEKRAQSLPLHRLHDGQPYWLGIFLVGAYQEALSDDHNLFGKFHVITIDESKDWQSSLQYTAGSSLRDVLEQVHHSCDGLLHRLDRISVRAVAEERISQRQADQHIAFFHKCANDYTYLSGDELTGNQESKPNLEGMHRRPKLAEAVKK